MVASCAAQVQMSSVNKINSYRLIEIKSVIVVGNSIEWDLRDCINVIFEDVPLNCDQVVENAAILVHYTREAAIIHMIVACVRDKMLLVFYFFGTQLMQYE